MALTREAATRGGPRAASARVLALRRAWGRWLPRLLLLVLVLGLAVAVQRLWLAQGLHAANRLLDEGRTAPGAPAMVVLGHATALEREGRVEEALAAYAQAESLGHAAIGHAARVNVANLYLRQGIAAAVDEGQAQRALVLVQLAKTTYRRALRDQPDDWNARYNLELAARLVPDHQVRSWRRQGSESEVEDSEVEKSGWSDMIGQPRGMH